MFSLSIVVPVLNEAPLLGDFLRQVRTAGPEAEIIVVDGGSADDTKPIAESLADVVLSAPPRRGRQMNAGAAIARGEIVWFLHADLRLPLSAVADINNVMADARIIGGCFRLRFPRQPLIYRVSDSLGNIGVDIFGFALGDHAIFCRRVAFEHIGGYSDVPILEDAELYRALGRAGRMVQLRPHVGCSPRAYEKHGPCRTTAVYFLILLLYVLRVPIATLHRIYLKLPAEDAPAAQRRELASTSSRIVSKAPVHVVTRRGRR